MALNYDPAQARYDHDKIRLMRNPDAKCHSGGILLRDIEVTQSYESRGFDYPVGLHSVTIPGRSEITITDSNGEDYQVADIRVEETVYHIRLLSGVELQVETPISHERKIPAEPSKYTGACIKMDVETEYNKEMHRKKKKPKKKRKKIDPIDRSVLPHPMCRKDR